MKKIFLFFFIIFFIYFVSSQITGETITGKISSQNFSISIGIINDLPEITINSPKSGSYLEEKDFIFNYTTNGDFVIFNLDNSKNKTLHQNEKISIDSGTHLIYVYVIKNNTIIEKVINISINPTLFKIKYENYKKENKGKSTDFYSYPYEEYPNFKNIVLENTEYGKIRFTEEINLIEDSNPSDKILDLDENTNISKNKIYLNSNSLPNFNKKSKINFYNVEFVNPEILKEGLVCIEPECKITQYENKNLEIEVLGFTTYEVREKPQTESISRGRTNNKNKEQLDSFEIIESKLIKKIKENEVKNAELNIKNKLNGTIEIEISASEFNNLIRPKAKNIILGPNEEKIIEFEIIATKEFEPNLYLGKIIFKSNSLTKEIIFLIEVESKQELFDVSIDVLKKDVKPKDKLPIIVELYNLGETDRIDATIEYYIINKNNEIIKKEKETVAVKTSLKTLKEIEIPQNLESDEYILLAKVNYENKIATASQEFFVEKIKKIETYYLVIIFLSTLIIMLIIILIKKKTKKKNYKRKKSKSRAK